MCGKLGAAAVSFTLHNIVPPEKGWARKGRNGNEGEDMEVGRIACTIHRIAELSSFLEEVGAREEGRRGLVAAGARRGGGGESS